MKSEINSHQFREDLYHRISVIIIHVPSLNERKDDIPLLATHFNEVICSEYGIPQRTFTPGAIQELQKITWTGNIREFRNVVERLIILCPNNIEAKDVIAFAQPISR